MHETSIINSILEEIKDKDSVIGISLEVGELAGITPEHLKEHLQDKVDWDIQVTEKASLIKCDCGYEGRAKIRQRLHDMVIFECPRCGDFPEVLEGKDIKILKIRYK